MTIEAAEFMLALVAAYLGVGALVGVIFAFYGAARLDEAARGTSLWFRLLIIPGAAVLWPIVLLRFLSGRRINRPIEREDA